MLVMPAPLIYNPANLSKLIVNALAPVSNTMPSKYVRGSWKFCMVTVVVFEVPNVAVSANPLGMVEGDQLLALIQASPPPGLVHVALPAKLLLAVVSRSVMIVAAVRR